MLNFGEMEHYHCSPDAIVKLLSVCPVQAVIDAFILTPGTGRN